MTDYSQYTVDVNGQWFMNGQPVAAPSGGDPAAEAAGGTSQAPPPPAPPAPPPFVSPSPGLTPEQQSAQAFISSTLQTYGLGTLGTWAWNEYLNGVPIEAIMLEMRQRPEYVQRFPGMGQLTQNGRAITEGAYIEYERSAIQILRAAGVPEGVMDSRQAIGDMIGGEVSLQEFQSRLNDYTRAVFQTPQDVRDQLQQFYGVGPGDILGFFLDEQATLPLLETRFMAAQAGAAAQRSGYGSIDRNYAERLAELGVTPEQVTTGFNTLAQGRELYNPLPGQSLSEDTISRDEQMAAQFEGAGGAQERIRRQQERRRAQFAGGGNFAGSDRGITGLR